MASITLKALPASLHRSLKRRAAENKRSLNQEVIEILERGVRQGAKIDIEAMLTREAALLDELKGKKVWATPEEIDRFKWEGRE